MGRRIENLANESSVPKPLRDAACNALGVVRACSIARQLSRGWLVLLSCDRFNDFISVRFFGEAHGTFSLYL
jgi:hypothetical protein